MGWFDKDKAPKEPRYCKGCGCILTMGSNYLPTTYDSYTGVGTREITYFWFCDKITDGPVETSPQYKQMYSQNYINGIYHTVEFIKIKKEIVAKVVCNG